MREQRLLFTRWFIISIRPAMYCSFAECGVDQIFDPIICNCKCNKGGYEICNGICLQTIGKISIQFNGIFYESFWISK